MSDWGGLAALFTSGFLASTLLPGGSEATLLLMSGEGVATPRLLWLTATLGNTLGGLSGWLIGWWLQRRFPGRGLQKAEQHKALGRIARFGAPVLMLSWLPVIGDPLCVAAGWSGVRLPPAALYIGLGKGLRYAALLLLLPAPP